MKIIKRDLFFEAYRACGGAKPLWYVKYLLRGF
jgi:hypothetical protein